MKRKLLLNKEQIKAVNTLNGNLVNLTKRGVRYHLDNLKKKGRIKRKGHGKVGRFYKIS